MAQVGLEARAGGLLARTVGEASGIIRRAYPVLAEKAVSVTPKTLADLITGLEKVQLQRGSSLFVNAPETVYRLPDVIKHEGRIKLGAVVSKNGSIITEEYYLRRPELTPIILFGSDRPRFSMRTVYHIDQFEDPEHAPSAGVVYYEENNLIGSYAPLLPIEAKTQLDSVVRGIKSYVQ